MSRVRWFIAVALVALTALSVVSVATARTSKTVSAAPPTLSATQVTCPTSYEGSNSCVEVSGCNYGNSGVLITLKSTGQISTVTKAGTTDGCFDTTIVGIGTGTWTVTATAPNGGPSASTTVDVS